MLKVRKAGEQERGVIAALCGPRGSGKTTTAAFLPRPIILAVEDGTQALAELGTHVVDVDREANGGGDTKRVLLDTMGDIARDGSYKTIVIDSATALLNKMIHDLVKDEPPHKRNLGQAGNGYYSARGTLLAWLEEINEAILWLARERKIHVVWIMHQRNDMQAHPIRGDYRTLAGEGEEKAVAVILNPCDIVCMVEVAMKTIKRGEQELVKGDGTRELSTGTHPATMTKSRFHKQFVTMPIKWGENPLPDIFTP